MRLELLATRNALTRVCAACTLLLLMFSCSHAMHELGDTAVYGHAYLWGERSLSTTGGVWADGWDRVQCWLFIGSLVVTTHALFRARGLRLVALSLVALLVLSMKRSYASDGSVGFAMTYNTFWFYAAWALVLVGVSLALPTTRKQPS